MAAATASTAATPFDPACLPAVGSASIVLAGQGLSSIPLDALRDHAPHVTSLDITDNALTDLAGLEVFSALDTLILDKNGLASLEGAPPLPTVKTLSFNNNAVDDMTTFLDSAVDVVPSVTFMSVMRNPASPPMIQLSEEDVAAATRHRLYVVYRIPSLTFLDAAPVTAAERAEAASKGKFLATRRAASTAVAPGAASPSAEAGAEGESPKQAKKGMTAFLDIGKSTYDGKHSEGNRFIVNDDL